MRTTVLLATILMAAATSGCVVAPAGPRGYGAVGATVYVEPTYARPGPGWEWERHPDRGWGWHHREHGWHQGWK